MDKVTRQCPQTTTFLKRKESRSGIEPRSFRLPAYRLTARPNRLTKIGSTSHWSQNVHQRSTTWCYFKTQGEVGSTSPWILRYHQVEHRWCTFRLVFFSVAEWSIDLKKIITWHCNGWLIVIVLTAAWARTAKICLQVLKLANGAANHCNFQRRGGR